MRGLLPVAFLACLASIAPVAHADDAPPSTLAADAEDPPVPSRRERVVADEGPFATKLALVAGFPVLVGLGFEQSLGDYLSLGGAFLLPLPYAVNAHARVYFAPRMSPWRWYVAPGVSLIVKGSGGAEPAIPEARVGVAYRTDGGTVFHLEAGAGFTQIEGLSTPVLPVGSIGWEFANPKPRWPRPVDAEDPPRTRSTPITPDTPVLSGEPIAADTPVTPGEPNTPDTPALSGELTTPGTPDTPSETPRERAVAHEGPFATKLVLVAGFPVITGLGVEQALGDYVSLGAALMLPLQDAMHAHARVYFEPRASPWRWYVAPGVSRLLEDAGSKTLMVPEARVGVAYRTDGGTVFHFDVGAGYSELMEFVSPVLPVGSVGWEFADLRSLLRRFR